MAVTLRKITDDLYLSADQERSGELWNALTSLYGQDGVPLYVGLRDNSLSALALALAYRDRYDNSTGRLVPRPVAPTAFQPRGYVNLPVLRASDAHVTDHATTPDYSDGYGGFYAPGE